MRSLDSRKNGALTSRYASVPFFILALMLCLPARGAEEALVSSLSTSDGLSDNCVNTILCDSRGLMWLGTNDGLDCYDGHAVRPVSFPSAEDASTYVFALCEDPSGLIWAGTSRGLFTYDRKTGLTEPYRRQLDGKNIGESKIRQMEMTASGQLWLCDADAGLVRIDSRTGEAAFFGISPRILAGDGKDRIFVLTSGNGLLVVDSGTDVPHTLSAGIDAALEGVPVNRLNYAFDHLFASGIIGDPLVIDIGKASFTRGYGLGPVKNMVAVGPSRVCVGSRHEIYLMDSSLSHGKHLIEISENAVRCLCTDKSGGIWVGTQFNGALRLEKNDISLKRYPPNGENPFKVREFAEDLEGGIWIGTDNRGLMFLNPMDGSLVQQGFGLRGKNILGLLAEERNLWVGTLDEKEVVMKINTASGSVTRYPSAGRQAYAFCRDDEGRLWIGGLNGFKVGQDYPDGRFIKEMEIPSSQVCRILKEGDGTVWVATISGVVWRFSNGSFSTYNVKTANFLTDLFIERNGDVVISSEGDGIFVFNKANDCFVSCRTEAKRFLRLSEEAGLLWATTPRRLWAIDGADRSAVLSLPGEKLDVGRFNYSSNFVSSRGMIYLGTSDGFISFSPDALLRRGATPSKPVLSFVKMLSPEVRTLSCDISTESPGISLKADAVSMEIGVSALDYSICSTERLFWRIAEKSDEWSPVQNGIVQLSGLESGKWTLEIKNESVDRSRKAVCEVRLDIESPPLLGPGAVALIVIGMLLLVAAVVLVTSRRTRIQVRKEQARRDYEAKLAFLTSTAHEIRTPLSLILLPLDSLIQKFSTSRDKDVVENLDVMKRNSMKLSIFINELLDYQKLNNANFSVHSEMMDVRIPFKDAFRRFSTTFIKEGKTLKLSLPDDPVYCESDVKILDRVLDNMLSNALKYSSKYASISLRHSDGDALFEFENDGEIVPLDKRDRIFDAFFRYDEGQNSKTDGTGLGLSTSKSFAELLGGTLAMDRDGKTNRFVFTLPVVSEHVPEVLSFDEVPRFDQTLMVVEDDTDMANVIAGYFKDSFNVVKAVNGKEALEQIEKGANPAIVITDVMMPEMNGIEFTRHLKENLSTSHIPVVLLSADVSDRSMLEGLEQGADAYIEKPFSPTVLVTRVNNLIQNRKKLYNFFASTPLDVNIPSTNLSNSEQKFLRSVQEYVAANISHEISIDDLAASVNMSTSTLFKKMKAYTGTAPLEYINGVRLKRAAELLLDDSMSVADVCFAVGFNTHSFFTSCFKRKYGMTPRQWRESSRRK